MRIFILAIVLLITGHDCFSQSETNSELVEIAVQGLIENSTIQNTTFSLEGKDYVFFQAFLDWVGTEYMHEGEEKGIMYKIWLPKHLFFYAIEYYIEIYDMKLDGDKLIVKYKTINAYSKLPIEYFEGIMKMIKTENGWKVKTNKLKK